MAPKRWFTAGYVVGKRDLLQVPSTLSTGEKNGSGTRDREPIGGLLRSRRLSARLGSSRAVLLADQVLLDMMLMFNLPGSIPMYSGAKFTAKSVEQICLWLNLSIDYGSPDHARAQAKVERLGVWVYEVIKKLCDLADPLGRRVVWIHATCLTRVSPTF